MRGGVPVAQSQMPVVVTVVYLGENVMKLSPCITFQHLLFFFIFHHNTSAAVGDKRKVCKQEDRRLCEESFQDSLMPARKQADEEAWKEED